MERQRGRAYCTYCGKEVDLSSTDTFQEVIGWVEMRGSKNFRTDRKGELFCHRYCLDLARKGLTGQQALTV